MKRFAGLVLFASGWLATYATPMISDLKVTSVEPIGIAIDFSVSGATEDDASLPFYVAISVNDVSYGATSLFGETNCVNGAHRVYWNMARDGVSVEPATASLTVEYSTCPRYCVLDLSGGPSAESYQVAYMSAPPSGGFNTTEYKTKKLVLKRVNEGSFIMGGDQTDESHRVTLTKPFYMGLYEMTQRQWELVTDSNPCSSTSCGKGDAHPVHCVVRNMVYGSSSANYSSSFLGKLRTRTGIDFELPTEAQWEYTCRAGTTTKYSYGETADEAYMWYSLNSTNSTHEVGTKLPNEWGFYDMHGNVWEGCADVWDTYSSTLSYGTDPTGPSHGSLQVIRGGCYYADADGCKSSARASISQSNNFNANGYGFRLSRNLPSVVDDASSTVEFALGRICADGSSIDGKTSLGYAPTESRNAVVAIGGEVLLNAGEAGSWTWLAATAGTYTVSHAVGSAVMSAAYVVTNGYVKVEENPNPPMKIVEGVSLTPSGEIVVAAKGAKQIVKISGNGEEWTGATSAEWLKLNSISGTAIGKSVICTIAENVDVEDRIGYVYIAGQSLKVSQSGRGGATVAESVEADPSGGEVAVAVAVTDETTTWSASSECPWIQVKTADETGSGNARFLVLPWNMATSRTGIVIVAGQAVTITQSAATFESPTATATNVVAEGESGALAVSTARGVIWSAISDAEWLVVKDDGASKRGAGTVSWVAMPQSLFTKRTATITVTPANESGLASLTFKVTQKAATLELSATSAEVTAQGGDISVSVTTAAGLEWTVADVPEWITLDGDTKRKGSDGVSLVVSSNVTFENRSATVMIAGAAFTVTQDAAKVEIDGGHVRCCNAAGIDSLVVTVRVDVATASWTTKISEKADGVWVFLMSGEEPVTGDGMLELYIAPVMDGDELPRTATVTVGNANLRIVQDDGVVIEDGNAPFVIPTSWFEKYPALGGTTVAEWQKIAEDSGLKTDASGAVLPVWHDYVAGTDPTDAASRLTTSIVFEDGKPVVSWSPALNGEGVREGVRTYRVWGKANLADAAWSEVAPDGESGYRFFRVTVEMP